MFRTKHIVKERLFIVLNRETMDEMNDFLIKHINAWIITIKRIEDKTVHYLVRYDA